MNKTEIEWCDYTWNVVSGCSPISAGCDNCYASRIANRFKGTKAFPDGFNVTLHPERLNEPLMLKGKGKRIFVCSMSDLFHDDVPDEFIAKVFDVMKANPQHTFFVLTKRPQRMVNKDWAVCTESLAADRGMMSMWYAPNIWVGVSVENQEAADKRIPVLLNLPAAHRFVSCEPLIGHANLEKYMTCQQTLDDCHARGLYPDHCSMDIKQCHNQNRLDWIIAGGETGPGARICEEGWMLDLASDCDTWNVPFFFKKWGSAGTNFMHLRREWPEGV